MISRQCGTKNFAVYSCGTIFLTREVLLVLSQVAIAGAFLYVPWRPL